MRRETVEIQYLGDIVTDKCGKGLVASRVDCGMFWFTGGLFDKFPGASVWSFTHQHTALDAYIPQFELPDRLTRFQLLALTWLSEFHLKPLSILSEFQPCSSPFVFVGLYVSTVFFLLISSTLPF